MPFPIKLHQPKIQLLLLGSISLLTMLIAIWFGIEHRLKYSDLGSPGATNQLISSLEAEVETGKTSDVSSFNLAVLNFKHGDFEKARTYFNAYINASNQTDTHKQAAFYNLGNTLFRMAEQEKDLNKGVALYQESLKYYRAALEIEKLLNQYTDSDKHHDDDLTFNFVLTRNRIKILMDQLAAQKNNANQQKDPYAILKDIQSNEKRIRTLVDGLAKEQKREEIQTIKEEIFKLRAETQKSMTLLKERLKQPPAAKPGQPPQVNLQQPMI